MAERTSSAVVGAADASGAEDEVVGHVCSFEVNGEHRSHFEHGTALAAKQEQCSHFCWNCGRLGPWTELADLPRPPRRARPPASWASGRATGSPSRRTSCASRASTWRPRAPPHSACGRSPATSGMVSSGIYRYVESRDELLTRLIVDSYWSLAARRRARPTTAVAAATTSRRGGTRSAAPCAPGRSAPARLRPDLRLAGPGLRGPGRTHRGARHGRARPARALLDDVRRAGRLADRDRLGLVDERARGRASAPCSRRRCSPRHDSTPLPWPGGSAAWTLLLGAVTSEVFAQLGPVPGRRGALREPPGRSRRCVIVTRRCLAELTGPPTPDGRQRAGATVGIRPHPSTGLSTPVCTA